jgi:hypothetical protein
MARRKTTTLKRPGRSRAELEAWRDLHRKLAGATTYSGAKLIANGGVPPHGERFFSNLGRFLRTFRPPARASRSELYVYQKLLRRFADAGDLKRDIEVDALMASLEAAKKRRA